MQNLIDGYTENRDRAHSRFADRDQTSRDFLHHCEQVLRPTLVEVVARLRVGGFPCMVFEATSSDDTPFITFAAAGGFLTISAAEAFGAQVLVEPGDGLRRDHALSDLTAAFVREEAIRMAESVVLD